MQVRGKALPPLQARCNTPNTLDLPTLRAASRPDQYYVIVEGLLLSRHLVNVDIRTDGIENDHVANEAQPQHRGLH